MRCAHLLPTAAFLMSVLSTASLSARTNARLPSDNWRHDATVDCVGVSFGFRSFEFDGQGRFLLNGRPVRMAGVNRHRTALPARLAKSPPHLMPQFQLLSIAGTQPFDDGSTIPTATIGTNKTP